MKQLMKTSLALGAIATLTLLNIPQSSDRKPNGSALNIVEPTKQLARALNSIGFQKAHAAGGPAAIDSLRDSLFLIIGYPSNAVYNDLTGGGGPTQVGLLGALNEYVSAIEEVVTSSYGFCSAIPSTGTATTSDGLVVTFQTPLRTSPTGFTGAGTPFEKRIKIVDAGGGISLAVEVMCEDNISFVEIDSDGDTIPNSARKMNVIVDGQGNKYEVYMAVDVAATNYDAQYIRLETDPSTQTFDLWVGSAYTRGSNNADYPANVKTEAWRAAIKGNYTTGEASVFFGYEDTTGYGANTLASVSDADTAVNAAANIAANRDFQVDTSTLSGGETLTGCVDFDDPTVNPVSTAYCAGLGIGCGQSGFDR